MSPRKKELNEQLRESRRIQILDAALSVYVRMGYNGTDMDIVAETAGLAKGLVYYYFKTKQDLFRAMFDRTLEETIGLSNQFIRNHAGLPSVERLVHYIWDIFSISLKDPRIIQFSMRMPFDAYAVFGEAQWREGMEKSVLHQRSIAMIIQQGVDSGEIPAVEANHAANCFWAVFVSNLFNFSKLIGAVSEKEPTSGDMSGKVKEIASFCFQGLGLRHEAWEPFLDRIIVEGEK